MPTFSDYDGTYSDHPEIHGDVDAIVTGRSWEEASDLFDEAGKLDIPVFFNPKASKDINVDAIVYHKANVINKAKVTTFYEDVPREAGMLDILCPNCKIILVTKGVTDIT